MVKRKIMRFLAGAMCSIMLVTSESMSGLAYAASVPEEVAAEQESLEEEASSEFPGGETGEGNTGEEDTGREESSESSEEEITTEAVTASSEEVNSEGESTPEGDTLEEDTSEENTLEGDTLTEEEATETDIFSEEETDGLLEEESLTLEADEQTGDTEQVVVECTIDNAYQFGGAPSVSEEIGVPADSASNEADDAAVVAYLYQEMKKRNSSIDVSSYNIPASQTDTGWTSEKARDLVGAVLNEHPDLYYVSGSYRFSLGSDGSEGYKVTTLIFTYTDGLDDIAFENAVNEALKTITGITDDVQKVILLHDYLAVNCEYDYENYLANNVPATSHSAYGVFVNRTAVCQGYALAYKYLLNRAGIDCYMVTSDSMNHAWNLVKLGGNYYQVDVTWDDPTWDLVGRAAHTNMLRSDAAFTNHKDWSVTSGSSVVNYEATDTTYDKAFWLDSNSPLILIDGEWYFTAYDQTSYRCSIQKRTLSDTEGTAICSFDYWPSWGESGSLWPGAYSGLSLINGRLYYNDKAKIYSIKPDGTDQKTEFTADTTNGYIYGSAYCQGKIYYSLHQSPNFDAKEEVLTADISLGTGGGNGEGGDEIEEPAEATDFEIIDEDGNILKKDADGKYEQITMIVGEQKMLGIKLLPEGSAVQTSPIWSSHTSRLSARDGILVANTASEDPVTVTVRLGSMEKEFQVMIREATAGDNGVQIDDVLINSTGIGTVAKIDDKTFNVNIDKDASLTLSYAGETEGVSIYYNNYNGRMLYDEEKQRLNNGKVYNSKTQISIKHDMAFQVAVVTGDTKQQQLVAGIYTINFHVCNSDFAITRSVRTIPGADDVELAAIRLPETAKIEDIEWTSGDTNIVSIGDKTENGVMIKIGKSVGTVQVTARVKDHKGKYVYAVCSVRVTKTVPTPSVSSNDAGWADVEDEEGDVVDGYWVIDNGGRITLAVKGVSDVEIFYTLDGSDPTENSNRYVGPITINKAVTIKAFARKAGYEDSDIMEERFKIGTSKLAISQTSLTVEQGKEKEITVKTVPTGTVKDEVTWVSSNPAVADAEIREKIGYRKDEDGVEEEYVIREYMVIHAYGEGKCTITASVTDYAGRTVEAQCIVNVPRKVSEPVFTPNESTGITMSEWKKVSTGEYDEEGNPETKDVEIKWVIVDKGGTIEITPADGEKSDDIIYYTTDGSKPTTSSKKYTGPIKITKKCTVKAIAAHTGCTSSDVVEMRYIPYDTSMTLSKTSMSVAAGKKQEISVKKWPTGPVDDRPSITWTSANDKVATVGTEIEEKEKTVYEWEEDDDGNMVKVSYKETIEIEHTYVYGVGSGKTQIIASYTDYAGNSREAVCNVTVTGKLEITPAITVTEGETAVLEIKKNQTGVAKEDIEWSWDMVGNNLIQDVSYDDETGKVNVTAKTMTDTSKPVTVVVTASATIEGKGEDAEDIEVEACCEVTVVPQSFTVTFIGWNGKTAKEEQVYRGQDATPPLSETMNTATPKGWIFKEWNEPDTAWKKITADTEIIAKYEKQTYTIQYEVGNKGTNPSDNPVSYTVDLIDVSGNSSDRGNLLVLKDAVSTDAAYVFAGWYKDSGYTGSPIVEIPKGSTGDLVLYAKWIPKNDGMWVVAIPDQTYTGKALKPEVIVYDGTKPLTLGVDYTVQYKNNTKANLGITDAEKKKLPTVIVKGKGNYTGSASVEFKILPRDISDSTQEDIFTADDLYMAYNGKVLKPAPVLKRNGKKLNNKTEYGIKEIKQVIVKEDGTEEDGPTVTECKEAGKYRVIIEGKGNYTGIRTVSLTITNSILMSNVSIGKIADIEWTGKAVDPSKVDPKLTYKKTTTLVKGTDYIVTYDTSAVDIGSYEVKFTGIGNYAGEVVKTFKIKGKAIKASNIKINGMQNKDYDGTQQTQDLIISYGSGKNAAAMVEGRDYTLTYLNNTNAGKKATVVIQGIGGYSGTVKKTFTIKAYSLKAGYDKDEVRVALAQEGPVYHEKGGAKPEVVVYCGERELSEGTDYTLKYKNNGKVAKTGDKKPPTVTVTGKGNFSGSVNLTFSIVPQDISLCSIAANDVMANAVSTKNPDRLTGAGKYKSTPVLTDRNGKKLAAGTDYKKQYVYTDENGNVLGSKDKIGAGSILTVTVTGTGSYQGEISVSYRVLSAKKSITSAKVSIKPEVKKDYSGEPVTISKDDLIVKIGNEELKASDYTIVSYSDNLKKGTATMTIQGIGEYGGTKTIKFSIRPKTVSWKESIANIFQ